jgi:hypothetical protein
MAVSSGENLERKRGSMLREYKAVKQNKDEPRRRWFNSEYFSLMIWCDEELVDRIVGFELCYDIQWDNLALTWWENSGTGAYRVDEGENDLGLMKMSPLLVADSDSGHEYERVMERFRQESQELPSHFVEFICEKIAQAS